MGLQIFCILMRLISILIYRHDALASSKRPGQKFEAPTKERMPLAAQDVIVVSTKRVPYIGKRT